MTTHSDSPASGLARITLTVEAPGLHEGETLYLSSAGNGWRPADPAYAFKRTHDGHFQLDLDLPPGGVLEYKLTRGAWSTVESDASGALGPNRRLAIFGSTTIRLTVEHWVDRTRRDAAGHDYRSEVRVLGPFPIPVLGRDREIAVYLPPGYHHDPKRRYPVLYMWDGQNLFDPATAFGGQEWKVDEICDHLILNGRLDPLIVVGIYNGGEHRLSELSPWRDARFKARGEGHAFFRWVVGWLKSYIDLEFRTLTEPEHTGVAGSSMGGLASLYAAYRYPLVFGRVAALSPAFWFARGQIFRYIASSSRSEGMTIYLDCGEKEKARVHPKRDFYKVALAMVELLRQQGFEDGRDLRWVSDPQGVHSEWYWSQRFGPALEFLFPAKG